MRLTGISNNLIICMMVQINKQRASSPNSANCCGGLAALLSPRVFKALSDPKRLSLFARLAEKQRPCTIGELAEGSEVDLSVVSRHLGMLRDAGIIRCVKRGKEVWCSVERNTVVQMLRDLANTLETCCPDETVHGELIAVRPHARS
jgi:DNA-binding transcriptional ArsR family regulator